MSVLTPDIEGVLAQLDATRAQVREERRRTMCALQDMKKAVDVELMRLEALEREAGDVQGG